MAHRKKRPANAPSPSSGASADTRLNRYLASCGLGSRRNCENLVREGRVELNGKICTGLGTRVSENDSVSVDGRRVAPAEETTILLNKPPGYLCTRSDGLERKTVYDLIPLHLHTLHHVGRLDQESQGLLVLTNSGALTQQLTHPSHRLEKEYLVQLERSFPPQLENRLIEGIPTTEGMARAVKVRFLSRKRLRITLDQGLKRQIRLMFEALGNNVTKLERIRIGSLMDASLPLGKWRHLSKRDVARLKQPRSPRSPRRKVGIEPQNKAC